MGVPLGKFGRRVGAPADALHLPRAGVGATSTSARQSWSEHVTEPLRSEDFHVHLPTGPKIGVVVEEDKLGCYVRS
jgi:L-alanine-DL-glutamate epimerase-like enolase superfamily enzyme